MMKQYNKLYSFGCSFTEGGGLNNQNFHRYLNGNTDYSDKPEGMLEYQKEYANYHSYSGYLSRMLGCEFDNHGTSRAGNEFIFNKAYDTISALENTDDILVVIQTSILSRMMIQLPHQKTFINVNNFVDIEDSVKKYYELYICEFYDFQYAYKKLLQEIDMFKSWFYSKNIDVVWMMYEMDTNNYPKGKHIVNFDGKSLGEFAGEHELRICDLPKFPYKDTHFSPKGNEVIADKIYEHVRVNYG